MRMPAGLTVKEELDWILENDPLELLREPTNEELQYIEDNPHMRGEQ